MVGLIVTPMGVVFLILGIVSVFILLSPDGRRRWYWGKFGSGPRLSWVSRLTLISFFFSVSATGFGLLHPVWVLVGFILLHATAVRDHLRNPLDPPRGWRIMMARLALALLLVAAIVLIVMAHSLDMFIVRIHTSS